MVAAGLLEGGVGFWCGWLLRGGGWCGSAAGLLESRTRSPGGYTQGRGMSYKLFFMEASLFDVV